jgi:glycosyltransferase involved in cell wall biosynthesis
MKLIVQIPCYNEEQTLPRTVADIPRQIEGIDRVEVLVIDDGSTDGTANVARQLGVDHLVRHTRNKGLASAFRTGLGVCLRLNADIIVNTDADNQYPGDEIANLIRPILEGRADVVVGDRQTRSLKHFSTGKRTLQALGSFVVRRLSDTEVPDAVSGFRALSREAALRINIVSSFSYTIEMLIQAGKKQLAVTSVPIQVNPQSRPSRLFRSVPHFIAQSVATMIRTYTIYKPLRVFTLLGLALVLLGLAPVARFLYFYFTGDGGGHIQSLVLAAVLLVTGFFTLLVGILADLIASNRKLIEMILERQREGEALRIGPAPDPDESGPV